MLFKPSVLLLGTTVNFPHHKGTLPFKAHRLSSIHHKNWTFKVGRDK